MTTPRNRTSGRLRLPPFGRRLFDLRRAGRVPGTRQVVIAISDWTLANAAREDVIVVPCGEPVRSFDFRCVAGLPVLMVVEEHHVELADQVAALVIGVGCKGCAALVMPAFEGGIGFKLYQSHFMGRPNVR